MADTATVPPPVAEEAPPKGRKKLRLVVVVLLVLLAGAAGLKMTVLSPSEAATEEEVVPEEGEIVAIGEMTTSLAGGGSHYVRVQLAAVLNATADATAAEGRFPLMRDRALGVLMAFTADELRTVEGAERLRTTLTREAQTVWEDEQVLRIVLTDLLVQ